jgi:hypothetical protein
MKVSGLVATVLTLSSIASASFAQSCSCCNKTNQASKIGIHLLGGGYTPGTKKIIAAKNLAVLKIMDLNDGMREAMRDYKKRHPKGVVVLRVWTPLHEVPKATNNGKPGMKMPYELSQDPAECARDFWYTRILPQLNLATKEELKMIDYIEGPNEGSDCPTWSTVEQARWFGRFWVELAQLIGKAGFKPCVGSIAVGNPGGSSEELAQKWQAFAPGMRMAKKYNGAWSYHSYTCEYTKDVGVENWFSLRYRMNRDIFKKANPDLADMKLILTEGGVDKHGDRLSDGWQERGTAEKYLDWLAWFDSEIKKDPYVIGVTLFQIGDDWWKSFNLEPMADKLAEYLNK